MMKSKFTAPFGGLLLLFLSSISAGQAGKSHILVAHESNLILVGEIVDLGKAPPSHLPISPHVNYQVVVFRVCEVIKGTYEERLIKVDVGFSTRMERLPDGTFTKGRQMILLLKQEKDFGNCTTAANEPEQYKRAVCYSLLLEYLILSNKVEVDAVKSLVAGSQKSE